MTTPPPPAGSRPGDADDDGDAFDRIIAGFGTESNDPVPRWPVSEDVSAEPPASAEPVSPARDLPPPAQEPLPAWLEPDALEDDGHYQPPPPPRIPLPSARTVVSTGMLLLGLVVMFAPFRIGLDDSTTFLMLGLALTTGGAGLLLYWMRDAPPRDSGPDDGAVI